MAEGRFHSFLSREHEARFTQAPKQHPTAPEGSAMVTTMRERWENYRHNDKAKELTSSVSLRSGDSPMLAQLKAGGHGGEEEGGASDAASRPKERGSVYAAQKMLAKKHHEAKSRLAGVSGVGGGVSLWPAMDDMRLSRSDALQLILVCTLLVAATIAVFYSMHGESCLCASVAAPYNHSPLRPSAP